LFSGKRKFEDPFFSADDSSLFDRNLPRLPEYESWSNFVWKRPEEVYGKWNYCLFETIEPNDVK